jgi:hypothetical protein
VGEIVSVGVVALGVLSAMTTAAFAALNVPLTIAWLAVARQHRQRTT